MESILFNLVDFRHAEVFGVASLKTKLLYTYLVATLHIISEFIRHTIKNGHFNLVLFFFY